MNYFFELKRKIGLRLLKVSVSLRFDSLADLTNFKKLRCKSSHSFSLSTIIINIRIITGHNDVD
jgi:hypothetical protein